MSSCARLPHPLFRPTPSPKPRSASALGPTPARSRALAVRAAAAARDDAHSPPSSFDFLALKRELELEEEGAVVPVEADEGGEAVSEGDEEKEAETSAGGTRRRRRRRQMARRSALLAKQVITDQCELGSEPWVRFAALGRRRLVGCCID
ncbi:unnamed protein product [Urochloa humidicola]